MYLIVHLFPVNLRGNSSPPGMAAVFHSLSALALVLQHGGLVAVRPAARMTAPACLANAVTNGLGGTKFCLSVKLCVKPERRSEFVECIQNNQKGTLATEPLAIEYVWGEDISEPNTFQCVAMPHTLQHKRCNAVSQLALT